MRRVSVGRVLAVVALALLVAGPAMAQDKEIVVAGGWAPSYYSASGFSTTAPLGFMVDVAGTVAPNIQIVGDLGYNRKSVTELDFSGNVSFLTATGGVRYLFSQVGGQAKPFVEGLVGLGYASEGIGGVGSGSQTGVAFGVGGGVDVKTPSAVGVRLQVNYFLNRISGVNVSEVRFGAGISFASKMK